MARAAAAALDGLDGGLQGSGNVSGLAVFDKNDSQIWSIIDQQVLARTTMTNDDIATICAEAQAQIDPLLK